ncbi:hypothetical protein B0H16DRAFT_1449368 [Mycena metata]|uniref:Uncharacterized protein n=1 Tax=Mycena metata TaxID=1033252 RepID=A0AAD7K522_9AGAR|nr:hypothetical protein B0H16DRAFT_1449368 [Mycena metata]
MISSSDNSIEGRAIKRHKSVLELVANSDMICHLYSPLNHAKKAITTAIYLPIKNGGAPSHLMSGAQLSPIKGGGAPSRLNTAISSRQTRRRVRTGAKNGGKFLKKIPATQATTCIDVRDTSDISGIPFIECEAITSGACRCD